MMFLPFDFTPPPLAIDPNQHHKHYGSNGDTGSYHKRTRKALKRKKTVKAMDRKRRKIERCRA